MGIEQIIAVMPKLIVIASLAIQLHFYFFHNGAHVYMNNWQSIDFRESMNALLTKKLLGQDTNFQLPTVIWQDNTAPQTWQTLDDFGNQESSETFSLGQEEQVIQTSTQIRILSAMVKHTRPLIQTSIKGKPIKLLLTFL